MGVLTGALSALSCFHPDANPALQVRADIPEQARKVRTLVLTSSTRLRTASVIHKYMSALFFFLNSQGQDLYKSKEVRDKQIVRVIGKVTCASELRKWPACKRIRKTVS